MSDSEKPKKEKTLKYMHYYPRFLIKNFCKITEKYDLYTKKYSKDNIREDYICAHRANSKKQEIDFFKYEQEDDRLTMHNNKKIEHIMAETLSMKDFNLNLYDENKQEYYEKTKKFEENFKQKFKIEHMIKFIEHLLIKAPNLRASKALVQYPGEIDTTKEIVNNLIYDSSIIRIRNRNSIKECFKKLIRDNINALGNENNLKALMLIMPYSFPLIDPGYNFFKLKEFKNVAFLLQLKENSFLVCAQTETIDEIREYYNGLWKQKNYKEIFNFFVRLMTLQNSLMKNIYFSKETIEFKKFIPNIQKKFDEMQKNKIISSVYCKKAFTEWRIPIIVDGNEHIELTAESYEETSICKALIFNDKLKVFFEKCDISKIKNFKMKDLKGKKLFIENGKIFLR